MVNRIVTRPEKIETLEDMFQHQEYLQTHVYGNGVSPRDYEAAWGRKEAINHYMVQHVAILDELHEALGEIGWKPWAASDHINHDAIKGELVDAWHFFMNLCMIAGVGAEDLIQGYINKSAKNEKRQAEGYDGVSTKCPLCKRALDDDAVDCYKPTGLLKGYCEQQDAYHNEI